MLAAHQSALAQQEETTMLVTLCGGALDPRETDTRFYGPIPQTRSSSSLPSPQSLSLSHFHCARMHRPFMQVNCPGWQRVPLSWIQYLLSAKYQRPSEGQPHSAPWGPAQKTVRHTWSRTVKTCNDPHVHRARGHTEFHKSNKAKMTSLPWEPLY